MKNDSPLPLVVRRLGRRDYEPIWREMQRFTDERTKDTLDQLWLVEHPPVFTLGQAGRPEHVIAPRDIPVIKVDRGGQVTYHGPGQLVAYVLFDLQRLGLGIRGLVQALERILTDILDEAGIPSRLREGAPGVYVGEKKIAALGLRVRRGCSFHGLALNVDMDLEPFQRINPCGYPGLETTQIADFDAQLSLNQTGTRLIKHLCRHLHYTVTKAD